ncbi:MAG TPA: PKD domain-containing protein [Longimicrobiales bacterium]
MKRLHPRAILALLFLAAACGDDGSGPTEPPIENDAPIADAGGDQEVVVGATVTLDGSGSSDPDGDAITYAWSLVSTPSGSAATLSGATASAPSFVADVAGTYTVELSVSDGAASDADTVSVTAADAKLELGGTIGADSTLPDLGVPYRVTAPLVVEATLTLEPGVVLVFGAGAGLTVNAGGSLVAVGTATDTIRFVGADEAEGSWDGVWVLSDSPDNALSYVEVANAGGSAGAVTVVPGARLALTHTLIRGSAGEGLFVYDGGVLSAFAANAFLDNTYAGVRVPTDQLGALDGASVYLGGNGRDVVEVGEGDFLADITWPKTDAPLQFSGYYYIDAAVTVEPGAHIVLTADSRLVVNADGSLHAVGTEADTIRFHGITATPGFWDGIEIHSNDPTNALSYVEVAHGGDPFLLGSVVVAGGARLELSHTLIRDSGSRGLYVNDGATLSGFAANAFRSNARSGLRIPVALMGSVDGASTYAGGNGDDWIEVGLGTIGMDQSWPKTDAPFRLDGAYSISAAVTVEPGAYLEFAEAAKFTVESGGSLHAVGTAEDTIRFVGAVASPGYWSGIRVLTNSDSNVLTYVDIGHGGRVDQGTVTVGAAAKLTVTNSHVHDSRTYGIYANTGAVVTLTDNTYANNASGDTNVQ